MIFAYAGDKPLDEPFEMRGDCDRFGVSVPRRMADSSSPRLRLDCCLEDEGRPRGSEAEGSAASGSESERLLRRLVEGASGSMSAVGEVLGDAVVGIVVGSVGAEGCGKVEAVDCGMDGLSAVDGAGGVCCALSASVKLAVVARIV